MDQDTPKVNAPDQVAGHSGIESDPDKDSGIRIIVNGRPKVVHQRELSFDEVVRLAFPNPHQEPEWVYTVTFSHGVDGQEGQLLPSQPVKITNGMIFNVTETNKS